MELGTGAAAASIVIDRPQSETPAFDPNAYEIRWGFNPVQREKILNARECGIARVPFARWFPIVSFPAPQEIHSIDWTMPKEGTATIPASQAELILLESLGGKGVQESVNWGLQTGFMGVRDAAQMAVINEVLTPQLSKIRLICAQHDLPLPISEVCEGTDELDFGGREECPTCWFKWLRSASCEAYLQIAAKTDVIVQERIPTTGEIIQRNVRPSLESLIEARRLVLEGFRLGINTLQKLWTDITTEYDREDSGRKTILDFEQNYRKDLHQNRPQDRQIALVQQVAKAASGNAGGNDALLERLAESQIQTSRILAEIAQRLPAADITQVSAPIPYEVSPVVDVVSSEPVTAAIEADEDDDGLSAAARELMNKTKS